MNAYIPSNLSLYTERHSNKYYYILTQLYYGRIFNKRIEHDSFICLSAKILHDILGCNYKKYLQFLLDNGIIETDNQYIIGQKSKGYRLTEKYRHRKFEQVLITDKSIIENVAMFRAEQENKIKLNQHRYIYDCLQQIKIDAEGAKNYIEQNIYNNEEYSSYNISVDLIESKSFFFTVDSTAGRIHNNITNLSRNLRPFLRYNNEKLVEIDIANSQPFIFNILINSYDTYSNNYKRCIYDTANIPSYVSNKKTDILIYRDCTSSGKFYEYLMDNLEIYEDRSLFKIRFFKKVFYSKENPYYISEERKRFTELFPNVSQIISYYKKDDYRNLAISLQKAEAEIMINKVVSKLAANGIYALTIHDSILTIPDKSEIAKEIILKEFKNHYGLVPTIKTK
jgi:stress-induced morphogen